ncbi:MAG TPA: polysaccharide deacetylase family protein [Casimicrobiaceae bacterium]|nr:polysaccharide deacetylase family protein [Casimicrobiaceae bacterium]
MQRVLAFATLAVAVLVGGCADVPRRETPVAPVAAPDVPPPPDEPVLARDREFAVVSVQPGEDFARLAERWLGDRSLRNRIAEFNGIDEARAGQVIAIPLKSPNAFGVTANAVQAVTILCYHRFGSRAGPLTVTPASFEAQMNYLARNGYHVIPIARLASFLEGRESLPQKSVVVTIDDGYRSMFEIAYPVLRRHRFPATVFLYTDFVGAPDALTWPQMKEMVASGLIEVQPHSKTHANLTLRLHDESEARYRDRARREVDFPSELIRSQLGTPVHAFAFPYGDVNDTVMNELRAKGIKLGVTVTPGGNPFYAPPFMLRRTMIFGGDDLDAFRAKLQASIPLGRQAVASQ